MTIMPNDSGGVRKTDPLPSHEAAASISVSRLQSIVYQTLVSHGAVNPSNHWLTVLHLEKILKPKGIDKWSISPRMCGLERKRLVETRIGPALNSSGKIRNMTYYRAIRAEVKVR